MEKLLPPDLQYLAEKRARDEQITRLLDILKDRDECLRGDETLQAQEAQNAYDQTIETLDPATIQRLQVHIEALGLQKREPEEATQSIASKFSTRARQKRTLP